MPRPRTSRAVAGGAGDGGRCLTPPLRRAAAPPECRPMRRHQAANAAAVDLGVGDGSAEAGPTASAQSAPPTTGDRPHRRRRRRHRPPPHGLGSGLPPADRGAATQNAEGDGSQPESAASSELGAAVAASDGAGGTTRYLRLPVRRRRRLPRPPGLQRGSADASPPNGDAPAGDTEASAPGAKRDFPPRRRLRRPPPRIGEAAPAGHNQSGDGARRETDRPSRGRGPNRRPGEEKPRDGQTQQFAETPRRERGRGPRDGDGSGLPGRERGDRNDRGARGRGPGGPRDGRGRGRDAPARRVEQKLYALESTVDRGFEDVPDEAEDRRSRRVHWTIVKRTVADQKSGKPMSATYVLQREGEETEFPNLGAARTAANKTIVHPEKLTMSKAEHVAAKNNDGRR